NGARSEAESHVLRILDRLPAREREFVEAMAELAPEDRSLTKIAHHMGYQKATDAGPTSQRLDISRRIVNRGKPYSFRHRAIGAYLTSEWPEAPGGVEGHAEVARLRAHSGHIPFDWARAPTSPRAPRRTRRRWVCRCRGSRSPFRRRRRGGGGGPGPAGRGPGRAFGGAGSGRPGRGRRAVR